LPVQFKVPVEYFHTFRNELHPPPKKNTSQFFRTDEVKKAQSLKKSRVVEHLNHAAKLLKKAASRPLLITDGADGRTPSALPDCL
jgi:hypothetical protein